MLGKSIRKASFSLWPCIILAISRSLKMTMWSDSLSYTVNWTSHVQCQVVMWPSADTCCWRVTLSWRTIPPLRWAMLQITGTANWLRSSQLYVFVLCHTIKTVLYIFSLKYNTLYFIVTWQILCVFLNDLFISRL